MTTIVYSKDYCPYCDMAKKLLEEKNESYKEININHVENPEEVLKEISNITKSKTFPQIVLNGKYIGGYTDLRDYYYQENQ